MLITGSVGIRTVRILDGIRM